MRWASSLASQVALLTRLSYAAPFLPSACRPLFDPESACPGNRASCLYWTFGELLFEMQASNHEVPQLVMDVAG